MATRWSQTFLKWRSAATVIDAPTLFGSETSVPGTSALPSSTAPPATIAGLRSGVNLFGVSVHQ